MDTEKLRNVAYAAKLLRLQEERSRQTGPGGLMHFVRHFWKVLEPGREFVDGWVLHAVAEHLEAIERGEITRLLVTIPPGFMKSLMINVWFMCWLWGPQNKPHFRSLSFSYASHLTERDNDKCRTLINSKPYQDLWGGRFKLSSDSKIKISNDHQGWLLASSVGGVSTGERGDLIRCFPYDELVATECGPIPIGKIVEEKMPIRVWSTNLDTGEASLRPIADWKHNPGSDLVKVTYSDGSSLRCTPDHRIWTSAGWVVAGLLQSGDVVPAPSVFDIANSWNAESVSAGKRDIGSFRSHNIPDIIVRKLGTFYSRTLGRFLFTNPHGMIFASANVGIENRQVQMSPSFSLQDKLYSSLPYTKVFGNFIPSFVRGHINNLPDNFFGKVRFSASKCTMRLAIRYIPCSCSVFNVAKNRICSVAVFMAHLLIRRARAKKSSCYKLMDASINRSTVPAQSNARITINERCGEEATLYPKGMSSHNKRFPWTLRPISLRDVCLFSFGVSGNTPNSSKIRDFVRAFKSWYWLPDFSRKVDFVEDCGHVDSTYCLTIDDKYHNFWVGSSAVSICSNCDDPHNAIQGESERVRNETVRWFKESMSNRVNDPEKSAIVVVHQRLNESDVAGSIIEDSEGMGYEHLCIPMRYEIDGPWAKSTKIGWEDPRKIDGELAWPERFPEKVVDDLERDLGPFGFSSQYQQNPAPRGGGIIKRHWFRLWENPQNKFPYFQNVVAAVDPAYTEKDENDPSAMAIFGTFRHPETNEFGIMLVHAWSKRLPIHGDTSPRFPGESHKAFERRCSDNWGLVEWIWHCCECYGVHQLFIEGKASGLSVFQEIERRQSLRSWACEIDTGKGAGDKVNRLTAVQPIFSQGLVWAPDRYWADLFINQLCSFPKAKHDDLVDCASSALGKMRVMGLIQHTDEREYEDYVEQNRPQALEPLYPV